MCTQYVSFKGTIIKLTKAAKPKDEDSEVDKFVWIYVQDESGIVKIVLCNEIVDKLLEDLQVGCEYKFHKFYCRKLLGNYKKYDVVQNLDISVFASKLYASEVEKLGSGEMRREIQFLSLQEAEKSSEYSCINIRESLVICCQKNETKDYERGSVSLVLADGKSFLTVCLIVNPQQNFCAEQSTGTIVKIRDARKVTSEFGSVNVEIYSDIDTVSSEDAPSEFMQWANGASIKDLNTEYQQRSSECLLVEFVNDLPQCSSRHVKLKAKVLCFSRVDQSSVFEGCPNKHCTYDGKFTPKGYKCACRQDTFKSSEVVLKYNLKVQLQGKFFQMASRCVEKLTGNPASDYKDLSEQVVDILQEDLNIWKKDILTFHVDCRKDHQVIVDVDIPTQE